MHGSQVFTSINHPSHHTFQLHIMKVQLLHEIPWIASLCMNSFYHSADDRNLTLNIYRAEAVFLCFISTCMTLPLTRSWNTGTLLQPISSLRYKVTSFYMNTEVFPGVMRICASPKSAKHSAGPRGRQNSIKY